MTSQHNFELLRERSIPEVNGVAKLYRHTRTGLELLSIENEDENKSFGVAFATPAPNHTGLPHILEHSVLAGSRKYPVKEPFVELLKTSLNTFLNAMTFDDMTIYPVASTNLKDFYNLVDVYLDAVFYPSISDKTLAQEGWHYEYDAESGKIFFKGVVFNEMKSVYSVPERVLGQVGQTALLPDTPYAYDSGGDPAYIPDLTYEDFVQFHRDYYHPSQARVYFYGDDDPAERLRLIDAFIAEFERNEVDTTLPRQPRFGAPRSVRHNYDAGEAGEDSNKALLTISWLLNEVTDTETILALQILEHILIDTPASPLRKALIDSGLGEDLTGGGLDPYKREATFTTGLKGIRSEDSAAVEQLILQTLQELVAHSIDRATIDASMNTVEFTLREKNTGQFPRGLVAMIQALPAWIHGGDPMAPIAFELPLQRVKDGLAANPRFFEEMIRKHFIENAHRVTTLLEPDPQAGAERAKAEEDRLAATQARLAEADLQRIAEEAAELKRLQEQPDSPEDLAKIPTLTLADLERSIKTTPSEVYEINGHTLYFHPQPTSGIAYVDVGMDLRALPQRLLSYIDLFGTALLEMGTEDEDYVQLSQRIGARTGGINAAPLLSMKRSEPGSVLRLFLRGKAMNNQTSDLLSIVRDVLHGAKFDDAERFRQLVLEDKAQREAYLGIIGQAIAGTRLAAHFTEAGWAQEQINGISTLFFVRDVAQKLERSWDAVLADLETIRGILLRQGFTLNITAEESAWPTLRSQIEGFLSEFPAQPITYPKWSLDDLPDAEGFSLPAQVNFVGKAANLYSIGYQLSGSHVTILKHMNLDYMWNRIRVQGGAYGGRAALDPITGLVTFLSWRDPNLLGTLEVYDGAADYLRGAELDAQALERAIIGGIGVLDTYLLPDAKGYQSMVRQLTGYTDAMRQQIRDEVLSTTLKDFRVFGEALADAVPNGKVAVVSSPDALAKANEKSNGLFTVTPVL